MNFGTFFVDNIFSFEPKKPPIFHFIWDFQNIFADGIRMSIYNVQ